MKNFIDGNKLFYIILILSLPKINIILILLLAGIK
jgi:hypothetical protein